MKQDAVTARIAWTLLASGLIHLGIWSVSGQAWEGALSLRKPALFGVSGGLTVWSLGWVLVYVPGRRWEQVASRSVSWALLAEVGLITLQCWRGVPSHFNHATRLDSAIEAAMLVFILLATAWIAWLWWRVQQPIKGSPAMVLAIRSGMFWLLLSCALGIATTVLGSWNMMRARNYETWGQAGVLKFPHGIALHAIQLLPLCAWLIERWQLPKPQVLMRGLAGSQLCLVLYSLWQTARGRARFDVDFGGSVWLVAACLSAVVPLIISLKAWRSPPLSRDRPAGPRG